MLPERSARPSTTACAPRSCRSRATSPRSAACNQAIRRLERLEGDLLAERHARIDDLALLVDLVSSGWKGVSERLERVEQRASARRPRRTAKPPRAPAQTRGSAGRAGSGCPCPTSLSSSIRPPSATASSRAIGRPSPVPRPSVDQNGRKIRSRFVGRDPRAGVRDVHGDRAVRGLRAPGRSGRRRASSGRRSRAGWR